MRECMEPAPDASWHSCTQLRRWPQPQKSRRTDWQSRNQATQMQTCPPDSALATLSVKTVCENRTPVDRCSARKPQAAEQDHLAHGRQTHAMAQDASQGDTTKEEQRSRTTNNAARQAGQESKWLTVFQIAPPCGAWFLRRETQTRRKNEQRVSLQEQSATNTASAGGRRERQAQSERRGQSVSGSHNRPSAPSTHWENVPPSATTPKTVSSAMACPDTKTHRA